MSPPISKASTDMAARWFAWRPLLVGAVLGAAAAGMVAGIAALCVIEFGWFAVGATSPHSRIVAWAVHTTMIHAVQDQAPKPDGLGRATPDQVRHGFAEYEDHCVMCHGGPGVGRAMWVRGLTPTPPFLVDATRKWSPAELHFIVAHGIKMTAMPAWLLSRPPNAIRDIVAFLERLPDISARQYADMRAARRNRQGRFKTSAAP